MAAVQRLQQGLRALTAFARPVDRDRAAAYLSPPLLACFDAMRRSEQQHSLNVLAELEAEGPVTVDLAVAALLHDAGKSRYPFPTWQKTMVVLVRAFLPRRFARLSQGSEHDRIARPFVISQQHPAWSASLAEQAGASSRAVWLIAHHADPPDQWTSHPDAPLLARLRAADDHN